MHVVEPLAEPDTIRLFAARVAAARPGFAVDHRTARERCAELDGLPGPIELAARSFTHDDADPADPAGRHCDDADPADAAMRDCSAPERLLCERLSVFAGSFTLAAVERVCADLPVLDLLTSLLDQSVVSRHPDRTESRYVLPKVFRRPRGTTDPQTVTLNRRLAAWHLDLARHAGAEYFTEHQASWIRRLRREAPNLAATLRHCTDDRRDARTGRELLTHLAPYWPVIFDDSGWTWHAALRGDAAAACHFAVQEPTPDLPPNEDASPLGRHELELSAHVALLDGRPDDALALLEKAHAAHAEADDPLGAWRTLNHLAFSTCESTPRQAAALADAALALATTSRAEWCRAASSWVTAYQRWRVRRYDEAAGLARQALDLHPADDRAGRARCLELLAWTAAARGRFRESARLLGLAEATGQSRPLPPALVREHDRCVDLVRRSIGDSAYTRAHRQGRDLPTARPVTPPPRHAERTSPLTPRELEVARGVAAGLTNREVAATLGVARRTAEAHVENILTKLDLTSRTQLAAWTAHHDRPDTDRRQLS